MQIIQGCGGFLLSLIVSLLFWSQAVPGTLVDPPRQEMQTVAPNVPVGPYLMNITGKTFANDMFLDVTLTAKGQTIPDGTTVTFDAVPTKGGDADVVGSVPAHAEAITKAGHAKLVPPIAVAGDWNVTITVAGTAGNGTAMVKMGVDPHSPPASLIYRLSQLAVPVIALVLLLGFFRLRHIDLEQRPMNRAQSHDGFVMGSGTVAR